MFSRIFLNLILYRTLKWIAGLPFYSFNNREELPIEDDEKLDTVN